MKFFRRLFSVEKSKPRKVISDPRRLECLLPGAFRPSQFNYLINWSSKHGLIYFETPKCGCSSVKKLLQWVEVGGNLSQLPDKTHIKKTSPLLSPFDDLNGFEKAFLSSETKKVTFVRNPYTRILSCYLEKIKRPAKQPPDRREMLGLPSSSDVSFRSFLEAIERQDPVKWDIHWAPLAALTLPATVAYDFIGRLENMDADLLRLAAVLGIEDPQALPIKQAPHATGANKLIHEYYDDTTKALVDRLYSQDFEVFGYAKSLKFL